MDAMLRGTVVYFSAYDVSFEVHREGLRSLLGAPLAPFAIDPTHRLPATLLTEGVWSADLPAFPVDAPGGGTASAACQVKLFGTGALSLTVRVPFAVAALGDLVPWHQLRIGGRPLRDHAHDLARRAFEDLRPQLVRPVAALVPDEAYTLFFLEAPALAVPDCGAWFAAHRREVAALLTEEPDAQRLSEDEVVDSTERRLSYYRDDLVVVDWDASLAIDVPQRLDEAVYPLELANVQLAELEAYDRQLEAVTERAYADVRARRSSDAAHELEAVRIDLARTGDALEDTGRLFGEWHLARIYRLAAERFHLPDWFRSVERKRETLEAIHQSIRADRNHTVMLWLEVAIVVLFVIDLIPLALELLHWWRGAA